MNTAMQSALSKAGVVKHIEPRKVVTPENPSRSATARVKNPLPVPTQCCNCGSEVRLVNNQEIYGRPYGDWPYAYVCQDDDCDSYVGLHPFTNIPLGTLATYEMREARKKAKAVFNPKWQSGKMTRSAAYAWLARELGIGDVNQCHIAWFDVATCNRVFEVCIRK